MNTEYNIFYGTKRRTLTLSELVEELDNLGWEYEFHNSDTRYPHVEIFIDSGNVQTMMLERI